MSGVENEESRVADRVALCCFTLKGLQGRAQWEVTAAGAWTKSRGVNHEGLCEEASEEAGSCSEASSALGWTLTL